MKNQHIGLRTLFISLFCVLFVFEAFASHKKVISWYNEESAKDLLGTLEWIKGNSEPEDVILTTWILGAQVVTYAHRGVVATSKVYPSEIKTVAERYRDISRFFFSQTEEDALKIIDKYNITYILVPRRFTFTMCKYIGVCDLTTEKKKSLTEIGWRTTMLGKMLRGRTLEYFSAVGGSGNYLVYKASGNQ